MSPAVLHVATIAGILLILSLVGLFSYNRRDQHGFRDGAIFLAFVALAYWFVALRR